MAGRRVYLENGTEAFTAKDIPSDAKVFISNGEPYKDPKKSLHCKYFATLQYQ